MAPSSTVPLRRRWSLRVREELARTVGVGVAGGAVGALFGSPWGGLAVAAVILLAVHLRALIALRAWAEHPKQVELPEAGGLWGEVYERLYERDRRSRKRKKDLLDVVAEFRASTAALPDGAVVLAQRGEIAWFNAAAQALLGLRAAQDVGLRIINLIRHPAFTAYMMGGDYSGEVEVRSPINASVTLSLKLTPYGQGQKLLIVRDVSERKRLEAARRDFISNASHELRTPLTVLRGYLDMMDPEKESGRPLEQWRQPLGEMSTQVARMQALVDDMLKLARLEADVLTAPQRLLDVPAMLRRTLAEAEALSQGRHRFSARIEDGLWVVGREGELQSVMTNLIQNAVQYTPAEGAIDVHWAADGQGAALSVIDTGVGIADEDIPRVTERFYRVDVGRSRASGGTGLGLSIVKLALENHEASLEIRSKLGEGSRIICRFPAYRIRRPDASATARGA